jgi:hypothetical protein
MNNAYLQSNTDCSNLQPLLSEYIDNTLSARQVWEVEKHLAYCADCTEQLRQLQSTVQILHTAPRYDTGKDFMASLHARLDGLEPKPTRGFSVLDGLRDWLAGLGATLQQHRLPALSVGLAVIALVLFFPINHTDDGTIQGTQITNTRMKEAHDTSLSVAAESDSSPFTDPAADNLEERAALKDSAQL